MPLTHSGHRLAPNPRRGRGVDRPEYFHRLDARRLADAWRRENASRIVGGDNRQWDFWRACFLARSLRNGR
jgi:hypothetical protein